MTVQNNTEINLEEVETRIDQLFDKYGEVPIGEKTYEVSSEEFDESDENYIGGAYSWVVRKPEDVQMSQDTLNESGVDTESVLMILGRVGKKWGLPGGGLEDDETFEETAIREVREEVSIDCSITDLYKIRHSKLVEKDGDRRAHFLQVFFDAVYEDGKIAVEDYEVNGAAWFTKPPAEDRMHPINVERCREWGWEL